MPSSSYCGLDFGTSNSTIGTRRGGEPILVPVEGDSVTIPSALFFNFETGNRSYGRAAIACYVEGAEGRHMRSLKSILGTELMSETTRLGSRSLPYSAIIGYFIGHLKKQAESFAGACLESVVLGRPVNFVDDDEAADKRAQHELEKIALAQGFKHVAFQFEPVAAALSHEQDVTSEHLALIVDIGGGTSDFSIIRISPARRAATDRRDDILANTGVHIGGSDFDSLLSLSAVMPLLGYRSPLRKSGTHTPNWLYADLSTWQKINFLYTHKMAKLVAELRVAAVTPGLLGRLETVLRLKLGHYLLMRAEEAKIRLSHAPSTDIDLQAVGDGLRSAVCSSEFHEAIAASLHRIFDAIRICLRSARIDAAQVTRIFTTGGSSAIPVIPLWLSANFPQAELVQGDQFGSVGLGLTIDAGRRFG